MLATVEAFTIQRARRTPAPYAVALSATLFAWMLCRILSPHPWFSIDDAYTTLHSAEVMHWGSDPNYIGVPALWGETSAPYLLLVYLLTFVLSPIRALDVACWSGFTAYCLSLVKMIRIADRSIRDSVLLMFIGLTGGIAITNLLSGMETTWAMAAVAWSIALGAEQKKTLSCLVAGVAAAIRPELVIYAAAVVVFSSVREAPTQRLKLLTLALAPMLPVMIWYLFATGLPIPLSATAKQYFFAEDRLPLRKRLAIEVVCALHLAIRCGPLAVAPVIGFRRTPFAKIATVLFLALLVGSFLKCPGAIAWNHFRYLAPLMPLMVWCLARTGSRGFVWACAAWCILLFPFLLSAIVKGQRDTRRNLTGTAEWSIKNLPANSVVLLHDAGYFAYATNFHTVDMVGLKTPQAMQINREITWPSAGAARGLAVAELAAQTHATHMILLHGWIDIDKLPDELRAAGWSVVPLHTDGAYFVFAIQPTQRTQGRF